MHSKMKDIYNDNKHFIESRLRDEDTKSEVFISWLQASVVLFFSILYWLSPKASDVGSIQPVVFVLLMVAPTIVLRLIIARQRNLDSLIVHFFIFLDVAFLTALIYSYHHQYNQPLTLSLKAPTFVYFFILLALRSLRHEKQFVIMTGVWSILAWIGLTTITYFSRKVVVTHSFVDYIFGDALLVGAEVDKIMVLALVTFVLTMSVKRTRHLFIKSVREISTAHTMLKLKNNELVKAKEKAEEALEAKAKFLSIMGHELRTPLNAVIGLSEFIREDASKNKLKEYETDASNIKASGERLLYLIERIFALSDDGPHPSQVLTPIETNHLKQSLGGVFENLHKPVYSYSVENRTSLKTFSSNLDIIKKIAFELITNANQFNRERGKVAIIIEQLKKEDTEHLAIRVYDEGRGIPHEHLDKIFEPFYQVEHYSSRKVNGAGVGLTLCRKLAYSIGANITCKTIPGEGSCFTLEIPLQATGCTSVDSDKKIRLLPKVG